MKFFFRLGQKIISNTGKFQEYLAQIIGAILKNICDWVLWQLQKTSFFLVSRLHCFLAQFQLNFITAVSLYTSYTSNESFFHLDFNYAGRFHFKTRGNFGAQKLMSPPVSYYI